MKVKSVSEVAQSCLTLSNPMDCSLPGSSVHGIFQARVLEWGAIAFSDTILQTSSKSQEAVILSRNAITSCILLNCHDLPCVVPVGCLTFRVQQEGGNLGTE